jgi:hypothetical protein
MTTPVTFTEMLHRLLRAEGQGRAAKTVEASGIWRRQDSFDFAMMTLAGARAAAKVRENKRLRTT